LLSVGGFQMSRNFIKAYISSWVDTRSPILSIHRLCPRFTATLVEYAGQRGCGLNSDTPRASRLEMTIVRFTDTAAGCAAARSE